MPEDIDLALLICMFGVHSDGKIEGRTRIQKMVCILKFKENLPFTFNFKPYYYGPYSDELSETINTLVGMKLLKEIIAPTRYYSYRYDYELTEQAKQLFSKIQQKNEDLITYLSEKVGELEHLSTPDLVGYAKRISGIESISI